MSPSLPLVPVFPLPGVVLFPHAELALHIFELRYRALVREALAGERRMALATLRPGWERDYHGSPEFHTLGTVAGFEDVTWLPNDCYDLRVRGLERVRLGSQAREFPFRVVRAEPLPQLPYAEDDPFTTMSRERLVEECRRRLPLGHEVWLAPPALADDAQYEVVVNTVAQCLRVPADEKLTWLAIDSVLDRGERVLARLQRIASGGAPPARPAGDRN